MSRGAGEREGESKKEGVWRGTGDCERVREKREHWVMAKRLQSTEIGGVCHAVHSQGAEQTCTQHEGCNLASCRKEHAVERLSNDCEEQKNK